MENIIYKGAINALSFGNVSYNILREFYRKNITVAFFPNGENLNFQAYKLNFSPPIVSFH